MMTKELEKHWEWRVFGKLPVLPDELLAGCKKKKRKSKELVDQYLWRPGCQANIKIRKKKLKIKELVRTTDDGFELWIESRALKFSFPLEDEPIGLLEKHLASTMPRNRIAACDKASDLIRELKTCDPQIKVVTIEKIRDKFLSEAHGEEISIEIAKIESPLNIESLCIEGDSVRDAEHELLNLAILRKIRESLQLPESLKVMGYVGFLEYLAHSEGFRG